MLEAVVLAGIGLRAASGLPPQATAVWPYDSYHDLRWLLVFHNSIPGFLVEFLVVTGARGLLTAGLTALAWPAQVTRPPFGVLVRRNLMVAAIAGLVISPWAALSVAFSAVALSWYLFASLIPMLMLSPFLQRAVVTRHWWRGLPTVELFGWSLLNFAVLTVAGALSSSATLWWAVPVAGAAGVANGLLWQRTVAASVMPARVRWPRVPVTPIAVALTMIAAVAAQSVIGLAAGGTQEWRPPVVSELLPDRVPYAVIAIAGHDSSWDGRPAADARVERFSYRGLDEQQRPLPYGPRATHRSVGSSATLLATHVEALHRRTGRPVALVGESEGATVARSYLERWPMSPVEAAVMVSPLVRPGRAYYPPPGHAGWGVVAGWELRAMLALANIPRPVRNNPDEPFVRSILANAPFYRNRMLCPVAGVRMVAFVPTVSAAEAPPGELARIPVVQMAAFHGGLLGEQVAHDMVIDFLAGEAVDQGRREYVLLQRLGAAWQPPPLPLAINPIWAADREGDSSFTGRICEGR
ncbi:MAG TPA: hypothetical protein VHN18_04765 [Micromonosporaceae bacterium]|nr:hypothetical protein [Micromonosporaceae bacterium]